jgi:hypothetical protein
MRAHRLIAVLAISFFVIVVFGWTEQSAAQSSPTYRGRILDVNTKQPLIGVVVEAQLQKDALPSGQRMVGRTKTDAQGRFVLQLSVNRSDIALIASKKGSTSKLINFGGQLSMMTDVERPLAIESHPSTRKENVISLASS